MKLSEFILLNEEQKKKTVLHQGILVAKRCYSRHLIFLFQLEGYYVETYCNRENKAIEEYRVFGGTKSLYPYLDSIVIDDLLN